MASDCELFKNNLDCILNRIKKHLPGKEHVRFQLKRRLHYHILSTISTERIPKWSRGRLSIEHNGKLFLILTNCQAVNHLDLEEYGVSYCCDPEDHYVDSIVDSDCPLVDLHPDWGDQHAKLYLQSHNLRPLHEVIEWKLEWLGRMMRKHCEIAALSSLLDRWDAGKYAGLMRTFLDPALQQCRGSDDGIDAYRQYLEVVVAGCADDSAAAVGALADLCDRAWSQYKNVFMSTYDHVFFRLHVARAGLSYAETFESRIPRQDVLFNAFVTGDDQLMRLGLELEWKSPYLGCIVNEMHDPLQQSHCRGNVCVEPSLWPRRKDPEHPISFKSHNSLEFYATFSFLAVWTIMRTGFDGRFIGLFRLLWRAIPTPYLPIRDMQRGVDLGKVIGVFLHSTINRPVAERRVWAILAEAFSDDPSAEFKPRTLKHLSRCAFRRRNRSPERIASLSIPQSVKQYLLLES